MRTADFHLNPVIRFCPDPMNPRLHAADNSCGAYRIVSSKKPIFGVEYCDATTAGNGVTQVRH